MIEYIIPPVCSINQILLLIIKKILLILQFFCFFLYKLHNPVQAFLYLTAFSAYSFIRRTYI